MFALLILLATFLTGGRGTDAALAQGPGEAPPVQAELLADTVAVRAGKPLTAGLFLRLALGWHTYWVNPGDSGLPVDVKWELPPGWKAGPLQWPVPFKHVESGDMITYGYEGEVLLMVEVTPPASLAPGSVTLLAHASWLACAKSCVPGSSDLVLKLPVATGGEALSSSNTAIFEKFRAQLPKAGPPPFTLRWQPHDTELHLTITPAPADTDFDFFPFDPLSGHPEELSSGVLRVPLPKDGPERSSPVVKGIFVGEHGGQRDGWVIGNGHAASESSASPRGTPVPLEKAAGSKLTAWRALLFGFIGGFILNLMPCVLPVIALKILGFLGQSGESRRRVFRLGLAFTAGIFGWFLALAVLIVAARSVGHQVNWAFQFQNPSFVLGGMLFLFVFALNLLGVFEIWLPGTSRLDSLSARQGYGGAFLHGLFATLLATPCTAPFLGSALGFALAQSGAMIFAMFTAIAAGMSLPYLLLTAQPGWMRFLPRPGVWMVRFKQAMGFLMLGTVVWLLGVYASQKGASAGPDALWLLLGIGVAGWVFGTWFTPDAGVPRKLAVVAAMVLAIGLGLRLGRPSAIAGWAPWSPQQVEALREQGKPVFVDFTAEWCTNCKYNERFVLAKPSVQAALKGIVALRGDWSRGDATISAELRRLGRAGVPVYVVYPAGGGAPEVLPEILTENLVLEALKNAKR